MIEITCLSFQSFIRPVLSDIKIFVEEFIFFSNLNITREFFTKATGGDLNAIDILTKSYLGFCVLRPIQARLGKTVLKWYKNREQNSSRITVQRNYKSHVAGIELHIKGLAWQQQDAGAGACVTIALWSALQSSAFDDFHSIPTTAEITKAAHKIASFGEKTFPSKGLTEVQLYEAIKELKLSPMIQTGFYNTTQKLFSPKEHFMSAIASYIRSGYPVIILGKLKVNQQYQGDHAVCVVGFRETPLKQSDPSKPITLADSESEILYIHDDNIGPNTRFKVEIQKSLDNKIHYPVLYPKAPEYNKSIKNIDGDSYQIIPERLVVAVHNELRASPDQLYFTGLSKVAMPLRKIYGTPLSLSTRFIKLTNYVHNELDHLLAGNPPVLSTLRLHLWEQVRPMSLHLGLVRIGTTKHSMPLLDVLYDTTDSKLQLLTHIPLYFLKN